MIRLYEYSNDWVWWGRFNDTQMDIIQQAKKQGLDIDKIDNPKLSEAQMTVILDGLKDGVDVTKYNDPK